MNKTSLEHVIKTFGR